MAEDIINDTLGRGRNQSKLPTYIVDNEKNNNYFANIGTNLNHTDQTDSNCIQT